MTCESLTPRTNESKESLKPKTNALIHLCIDQSGSMDIHKSEVIKAVRLYARKVADNHVDYKVNLQTFNTESTFPFVEVQCQAFGNLVGPDTYKPDDDTALHDAVLEGIQRVDHIAKLFSHVLFLVVTDGADNASHHPVSKVLAEVKARDGWGWTFVLLGANQNSVQTARDMGIKPENSLDFDVSNIEKVMAMIAEKTKQHQKALSNGIVKGFLN